MNYNIHSVFYSYWENSRGRRESKVCPGIYLSIYNNRHRKPVAILIGNISPTATATQSTITSPPPFFPLRNAHSLRNFVVCNYKMSQTPIFEIRIKSPNRQWRTKVTSKRRSCLGLQPRNRAQDTGFLDSESQISLHIIRK